MSNGIQKFRNRQPVRQEFIGHDGISIELGEFVVNWNAIERARCCGAAKCSEEVELPHLTLGFALWPIGTLHYDVHALKGFS